MTSRSIVNLLGLQLKPTRIKGSHYLLIPKDLAELLEISDRSLLNLTIEDNDKGQRLIYAIVQDNSHVNQPEHDDPSNQSTAPLQ